MKKIVNTEGYAYHGANMGDLEGTPNPRKLNSLMKGEYYE